MPARRRQVRSDRRGRRVPPALHGKFSELEPFARGRTGTTYLAKQSSSGYRGLLKVIPLAHIDASERVRLEARAAQADAARHEGLPRILDGGEAGNDLWLFREHVQGESLAQRIRRLEQARRALGAADHRAGRERARRAAAQRPAAPRREAGPRDPLRRAVGLPIAKLIDAGLPGRLPSGSVFDLLGTPAYISPEQVAGKLVSFRSDLYALGCVLFEMLSGLPPFPDSDVRAVLEAHKSTPAPSLEHRAARAGADVAARDAGEGAAPAAVLGATGAAHARAAAAARRGAARARRASARRCQRAHTAPAVTEEIELEEIEVAIKPRPDRRRSPWVRTTSKRSIRSNPGPRTLSLSADDIEALEVREEEAAREQPTEVGRARMPACRKRLSASPSRSPRR